MGSGNQPPKQLNFDPGEVFELSETKKVQIKEFNEKIFIDFREYYVK